MKTPSIFSRAGGVFVGQFRGLAQALSLLLFTSGLTACSSPNTYTTARALDAGQFRVLIAVEQLETDDDDESIRAVTPGFRLGIGKGVDLGARAPNFRAIAVDAKIELGRGTFDMAFAPAFVVSPLPDEAMASFVHMPLMISHYFTDAFAVTLVPGISYGAASRGKPPHPASMYDLSGLADDVLTGPIARFGMGVLFQLSKRTTIGPEVTLFAPLEGEHSVRLYGGIGLHL